MFKIITIPFERIKKGFDEELLNRLTLNKQVKSYRCEFFKDSEEAYWTVFLEYDPLLEKTPEQNLEGLDEPQKMLLDRIKAWRKERAAKDGIPVYIIGTNREMVDIVKARPVSLEALKAVKGFGKGKIDRYGEEIIGIIRGFYDKT
jgi:superfamily II DNA helicase RecQ